MVEISFTIYNNRVLKHNNTLLACFSLGPKILHFLKFPYYIENHQEEDSLSIMDKPAELICHACIVSKRPLFGHSTVHGT